MSRCMRCGRPLSNPHSIARSLGPVCYGKSGGGAFDKDLRANDEEWARREKVLQAGGEIDLGVNWQYYEPDEGIYNMRVSVRHKDGAYEAYGHLYLIGKGAREVVFARSQDLKLVYREAIAAGPTYTAQAYRMRREAGKKAMRKWRQAQAG